MLGTARENVRVAHALEDLPVTSAEMKTGKISYAKVRAMTRVATPETEKMLLKYAHAGSAGLVAERARQPVAEIPAAFDWRCIPAGRCALRRSSLKWRCHSHSSLLASRALRRSRC